MFDTSIPMDDVFPASVTCCKVGMYEALATYEAVATYDAVWAVVT